MVLELASPSGLILRRDAVAVGYDDNHLGQLVRGGQITRIRQGAYSVSRPWAEHDARSRHAVLVEAVTKQYDINIMISHDSAVVRHAGPDYGLDLSMVHVTHFDGGGRRTAGVVHHEGECRLLDVTKVQGFWCSSPPRAVLEVAVTHGLEVGVVVADDFIRRKLTSPEELRMLCEHMRFWPGALILRLVIDLATGRSESVGESLGWLLFRNQQLPRPEQQFEVFHPGGRLAGRTDWAWPDHKLLGEFDGLGKYLRSRREGESVTDCVLREKRREDLLRELTGWRFIRLIWSDLLRPEATAARIRASLADAA